MAADGFLADVRVLDVTQVVAGSFASMSLADLGAEVLKIERPDGGDIGRTNPPFVGERSAYFASVNRNKASVAIDLKSAAGREAFLDLAREADVVVENHPPGRMAGFGLDYEGVAEANPEIVHCSITGFGQTGPYASLPALDMVAQALSGHMSLTGPAAGPPFRAGLPIADLTAATYAAQGIVAALYRRERTGEGEYLDVSMVDVLVSFLSVRAGYTFATGDRYPRTGNQLREFVPYNVFETADGHLALIVATDRHWRRLCEAIDRPGLAEDDRYATVEARRERTEEINDLLSATFEAGTATEWFERLADHGVASAPVLDTATVWENEHVRARGLERELPLGGEPFSTIAYPIQFAGTETPIERGAPDLGEDTRAALARVGYDDDRLDRLLAGGVLGEPDG